MEKPFDYAKLMKAIKVAIEKETGVQCIEANSVGKEPAYPFFSWDFVNAHKDLGFTDNVTEEVFEASIMFQAHSQKMTEALNLASWLRKLMLSQSFYDVASANNFYVVDADEVTDTNNVISIQVEKRAGVQVNLRIKDSFRDNVPAIENINPNTDTDSNKEG